MKNTLTFAVGNAKLGKEITTFSLPSGYTCPSAHFCLSKADRVTGKVSDGEQTQFRCFSASQEAVFPSVRLSRWNNFEALKIFGSNYLEIANLIEKSLPKQDIVRLHVAGDFYSQAYFDAWIQVAKNNPSKVFYAYTKSLNYWIKRKNEIPENFKLNASKGGKHDDLIAEHSLKFAEVVLTEQEAVDKGLSIDHDDSHAYAQDDSFALLIHGTQPKGSKAGVALSALRKQGKGGYGKKKQSKKD